ncbi:hypothetical protein QTP86_001349 [Hemibagrus guttatus]|nr:hypothetical protein QTP86_001349 [Hemibagrus guttatus]
MLQTISPDLLPFITTVINGSLTSGHVPTVFKKARVIPIWKKPTLEPSDISNYRLVSLLSFISKILERVVCNQLSDYLLQNNLHDPNQSGFKATHSTETALLAVTEKLHAARSTKLSSVLILLDLSAAFDTVNHKTLLSTLRSLGICGTAWEWFASYLDGRSYQDTDALGSCTKGKKMGILEVVNDCTAYSGSNSTLVNVAVLLEEELVMDNLGDFIKAFILLFGLLYALNIEYSKDLRYTLEAVQKIFVNFGRVLDSMEQHGNGLLPIWMVAHIRYHGFCSDLIVSGRHIIVDDASSIQAKLKKIKSFWLLPVRGRRRSGPTGPHNNLANVLCWMPFLTQPSHFSGLGTGTASSGWESNPGLPHDRQETYH